MITSTGVGVGGVGGIGMLRARRRDVSVKPNRKLDRKSSRGMIYENEELRLRTIQINAEVEQGQNDIKKLRRENEQLRREIWCLREEYDKLEEILKNQKSRGDSEDSEDCSDEEDEDDLSSGSEAEGEVEEEEEENDEEEDGDEDDNEGDEQKKIKLVLSNELIKDELFENAENQKLSSEKSNRLYVEFDQLSIVDEEDESIKKEKKCRDVGEAKSNMQKDGYISGHAFNWIISPECPSIPFSKEQSLFSNSTPGISTMINSEGGQARLPPLPPSPSQIGWEREVFKGDIGHTSTTMDRQTCAESIARASCRLPRDTSGFSVFPDPRSLVTSTEVSANTVAPSSSSENTSSTIIQKTSPDICVAGAVASQKNFGSSDQLLTSNARDSLNKSYSCQELAKSKSFSSSMTQGVEAKSLPDNSTPRAFKSQLKVQLNKLPSETPPEMPPEMSPIDWTPGQSFYGTPESLRHRLVPQFPFNEYQATSFESPTPRSLTLPSIPFSAYARLSRSEKKIVPAWPNVPTTLKVVDTQTQTRHRSSSRSGSRSRSASTSSIEQDDRKDSKSPSKSKKKKQKSPANKVTVSIRSSDDPKTRHEDKPERRSSSSGHENYRKPPKSGRYSQSAKKRASSRSQSIAQQGSETPEISTKERRVIGAEKTRKNSTASDSVPWCACWGNGCV